MSGREEEEASSAAAVRDEVLVVAVLCLPSASKGGARMLWGNLLIVPRNRLGPGEGRPGAPYKCLLSSCNFVSWSDAVEPGSLTGGRTDSGDKKGILEARM